MRACIAHAPVANAIAIVFGRQIDSSAIGKVGRALGVVFDRQLDRLGEELERGHAVLEAALKRSIALHADRL